MKSISLTANKCKLIAVLSMIIDHIGAILYPGTMIFRRIGRLAFPIFIFFLAEGFFHTKSRSRYLARLLIFAFISELSFNLAFSLHPVHYQTKNIFFTLSAGFAAMILLDILYEMPLSSAKSWFLGLLMILLVVLLLFLCDFFSTDYGSFGMLAICFGYFLRRLSLHRCLIYAGIVSILIIHNAMEAWALFAILPIFLYNGRHGVKNTFTKLFFYVFYPVHLLILYFIKVNLY